MSSWGPQNGRWGLEKGPILIYWALWSTFAKYVFWSEHSFYEKQILKASLRDKQVKEQLLQKIKFANGVEDFVTKFKNGEMTAEELGKSIAGMNWSSMKHCRDTYFEIKIPA